MTIFKYINAICNKPVSKKFDNLSLVVIHLRKAFHAFEKKVQRIIAEKKKIKKIMKRKPNFQYNL